MTESLPPSLHRLKPSKPARAWMLGASAGVAVGAVLILLIAGQGV